MGVDEGGEMGDRRTLGQSSLELLDFRVKQLEDASLIRRMQNAETTISQVQAEVRSITEITRGFSGKLDAAVAELKEKQSDEYTFLRDNQEIGRAHV